jgi:cell division protease FtsH
MLDSEVKRIADECHQRALRMLRQHRKQLDALAHALLEHETLDEPDAYAAAGIPHAQPVAEPSARELAPMAPTSNAR